MNVKKCVRALLCLYFTLIISINAVNGQELKVGDILPPQLWSMPLQVINHPQGKETMTLEEHKDKLIILDFWATWCSPCIAMLPKQDSLQKQFKDQIQILPVSYQTGEEVSTFMERYERRTGREIALPKVTDEQRLHRAFPHTAVPHYVWIGTDGRVKAITGHDEITAGKIEAMLSSAKPALSTKTDPKRVAYDSSKPFLVNGNGGDGSNLIRQSVLTGYTEGIKGGFSIKLDSSGSGKLSLMNVSLNRYYLYSYGADSVWFGPSRIELHMKEPQRVFYNDSLGSLEEWRHKYAHCYQLVMPRASRLQLFNALREDLHRMFPDIVASIEPRRKLCWILSRIPGREIPLASEGAYISRMEPSGYTLQNARLKGLVSNMNIFILHESPIPLLDETGITEKLNLEINVPLSDMALVSKDLEKYGLRITQEYRDINVLVLRDKEIKQ